MTTPTITVITRQDDCLNARWQDGHDSQFDYLWLRDNCPTAFHPSTQERNFNLLSVADDLRPDDVCLREDSLEILWSDQHRSVFTYDWLYQHDYSNTQDVESEKPFKSKRWKQQYGDSLYQADYDVLQADEQQFLDWLLQLQNIGLVIVKRVPSEIGILEQFARLISHIRETNFGLVFDVLSKPKPNNQAYTAEALPLHSDLPNQELPPGYQFLHCLENESTGGDSLFVDGFAVAETLQQQHPEDFRLLSEQAIPFRFHDETHDLLERKPVIVTDNGVIDEINYNAHIATIFRLPAALMRPYYLAYRRLMALLNRPDFLVRFRLSRGDMVVFDNRRVLHGRSAFDPNTGRRHLRGCYVDRGDLKSKIRVLRKKHGRR